MILIVGQNQDPHVASVAHKLCQNGRKFFVLDSFGTKSDGFRSSTSNNVAIKINSADFNLEDISCIWWRQKPRFIVPNESAVDLYNYYFLHREWSQFIDCIYIKKENCLQINNKKSEMRANNKIFQLEVASEVGFLVPETLICNDFEEILDFVRRNGTCIFKTFTPYMSPNGMVTFTTVVDENIILDKKLSFSTAPGIFQKFIHKKFELRVTVVGSDIFTARIDSKKSNHVYIDWRQDVFSDIYTSYNVEKIISEKILKMHEKLGLIYGAYDFIVDENNNYIFLEVNPSGQWMWIEQALDLPISEKIAHQLYKNT